MTREALAQKILFKVKKIKENSQLAALHTPEQRNQLLHSMALQIKQDKTAILAGNKIDLENSVQLIHQGRLTQAASERLKLTETKLDDIISGIEQVVALPDPLGQITLNRELDAGLDLYRVTCPIGVIAVIFESRPDVLPQIISLCIKSGNAAILKGGAEASHTIKQLFASIRKAIKSAGVEHDIFELLEDRDEVDALLRADNYVDLIIPRGGNELVGYVMNNTNIPVLGHAAGVCHIYIDEDADLSMALTICVDAKVQYPAACNAAEAFLVHRAVAARFLPTLMEALNKQQVEVRFHKNVLEQFDVSVFSNAREAVDADWGTEYSDLVVAIKIVDSLDEATQHINRFGSHHTDAIVTEDNQAADRFFQIVDSASVFHNASTRFADGFRYGFGAEVGISNGKLHPRGPVGLEGMVTYKYRLAGKGHVVADYAGHNARKFTHRDGINKGK